MKSFIAFPLSILPQNFDLYLYWFFFFFLSQSISFIFHPTTITSYFMHNFSRHSVSFHLRHIFDLFYAPIPSPVSLYSLLRSPQVTITTNVLKISIHIPVHTFRYTWNLVMMSFGKWVREVQSVINAKKKKKSKKNVKK